MLAEQPDWSIIDERLAAAVRRSISTAFDAGAVVPGPRDSTSLFRRAVNDAVTRIEERGVLLKRFLELGPYEGEGAIPRNLRSLRLADEEVDRAIAFIYCHVVNSFKGALTELLALGEVVALLERLYREEGIRERATVFACDSVMLAGQGGWKKGADMHLLAQRTGSALSYDQVGVVEVKSYRAPQRRLRAQMERHVKRSGGYVQIIDGSDEPRVTTLGIVEPHSLISVVPSNWKLPRDFWFEDDADRTFLHTADYEAPHEPARSERVGVHEWRVELPWSCEMIAASAIELTFWYMGCLGAQLYANGVPREWQEMSAEEAGQNAAKVMLYYAIRRASSTRARQRALGLYNSYGFGYSLGMNFVDKRGQRQMLWVQDLREILASGKTENGCTIQ